MELRAKSYRWLLTSRLSVKDFRGVQSSIREILYSEKIGFGFFISSATPDLITGRFVERSIRVSELIDAFGGLQQLKWAEYQSCDFTFYRSDGLIEVCGSLKMLKSIINQFGLISKWNLPFEPCVIGPMAFLSFLKSSKFQFDVIKAEVAGISLSADSSASIVVDGTHKVMADLTRLVGLRKHRIDRIIVQIIKDDASAVLDVMESGRVTSSGDFALSLYRKAILAELV
jgi:hypothetical protein